MKGYNQWSYCPYRPLMTDIGDIYICRLAPGVDTIHLEWLAVVAGQYDVFARVRGADAAYTHAGTTAGTEFDLTGLETDTDYEFYVQAGSLKSRVRLARTGRTVGTVVNYLHPDDEVYAFSGRYLCSPSLLRLPDGGLLASMDLFAPEHPQNLTLIFRSDDDGRTWHHLSELMPCFWAKLFLHKGDVYALACSTEYGDLLIGKSTDGGKTFGAPVTLLRGSNAKHGNTGVHKNPQNIHIYNGRLYETLEWGSWNNQEYRHAAMVMSCAVDDDLLIPENWSITEPQRFEHFTPELADLPANSMTIEGTLVTAPDGKLLNIMRFEKFGHALVYEVDTVDHEAPLCYRRLMEFPANFSKFMIQYDPISEAYYTVCTRLHETADRRTRNLLSLMVSKDLVRWRVACDLLDYRHEDRTKIGFQYPDFMFEGDDILYLCRTALNNAHNHHDANYSTFHRIPNFRAL